MRSALILSRKPGERVLLFVFASKLTSCGEPFGEGTVVAEGVGLFAEIAFHLEETLLM